MKRHPPIFKNCLCGKEFKTWVSVIKKGKGRFCSKICSWKHNPERKSGFTGKHHTEEIRQSISRTLKLKKNN